MPSIKKSLHLFLLVGLLSLLAACSTVKQPTFTQDSPHYLKAQGKLAIIYTDNTNTTHSESGRFNWQQQQEIFNWYIAGPFGLGWINLSGNSQQVRLTSQNGITDNATTPELLLQKYQLPSLPLSDLNWWIKGQPNPNKPFAFTQVNTNSPRSFTQGEATIRYSDSKTALPKKIDISLAQGKVKIFISQWQQGGTL